MHLGVLSRLSDAETRSISPENLTGAKGQGGRAAEGNSLHCARDLGTGWKVNPYLKIAPGATLTLAEIDGPGAIQHIWLTPARIPFRHAIIRFYWDGQTQPSVECPIGDFFACGWNQYAQVSSLPICVNPGSAFNCYWEMPFRKHCKITIENRDPQTEMTVYYQIDYTLTQVPDDAAYFHAQFRRSNPLPYKKVYTMIDGVKGQGHYVGTYMAWGQNNNGWWGEGEIKFYLDGDIKPGQKYAEETDDKAAAAYPTICGTGTEDYFCGSYNFENQQTKRYQEFTTPYAGVPQVIRGTADTNDMYKNQHRFGLYRWHIMDPVRFKQDLTITMQAIGWRSYGRYLPLQDDISSVVFWYQTLPTAPFPQLPDRDYLEII